MQNETSISTLAFLEKVDVRLAWENESLDFIPWLADNLDLLSDAIGISLELEVTEKPVGVFNADILAKDIDTNSWVVIESQLERTDHSHLGQIITYASGLKAVTIVWIATAFMEEHRAAIDWLNEITDTSVKFFALELELWKIGDSPYAPKLNVVAKPNDWQKANVNYARAVNVSRQTRQTRKIDTSTIPSEGRTVYIDEAARILNCDRRKIKNLIERGTLRTAPRNKDLIMVSSLRPYIALRQANSIKETDSPRDTEETENLDITE